MQLSNIVPAPTSSWLVRYRFDSPKSLVDHLSLSDGFFVPAPPQPGSEGARAIVEIGLPDGVPRFIHGRIARRLREGIWLDTPWSASLAQRMLPTPSRAHRRFGCDLFVEAGRSGAEPWMFRALELSAGGLRLAAGSQELGIPGEELEVAVLAAEALSRLRAKIAWVGNRSAGLQIVDADAGFADVLLAVEARWHEVPEIAHDAGCVCAESARPPRVSPPASASPRAGCSATTLSGSRESLRRTSRP